MTEQDCANMVAIWRHYAREYAAIDRPKALRYARLANQMQTMIDGGKLHRIEHIKTINMRPGSKVKPEELPPVVKRRRRTKAELNIATTLPP